MNNIKLFRPEEFYPIPQDRVKSPRKTIFETGDIVEILIGPATGRLGRIVVDRNGNYNDCEPYCDPEGVGVSVVEETNTSEQIQKIIGGLTTQDPRAHTVVRWFDGKDITQQLKLVSKSKN
jgi:hypothetical protein